MIKKECVLMIKNLTVSHYFSLSVVRDAVNVTIPLQPQAAEKAHWCSETDILCAAQATSSSQRSVLNVLVISSRPLT